MSRRLAGLLLAIIAATGLLATPAGVAEVRAAAPDLTIVSNARYDVQPDQHRVRITLDMVLTNHLRDTTTKRYYFDRAFLSVLPDTSGFKLTGAGGASARAVVSKRTSTYTLLRLDLGQRIFSGKSASYRLVFDLVDKGGAPSRDIRVGRSLVSFPVWAYATDSTPGSTVRVVFPAGYQVEVQAGEIPAPTTGTDGTVTFQTPKLDKPLAFFAYLVADRPATYAETKRRATVGSTLVDLEIRGWADDTAWSDRVGGLVARALPLLSKQIGLDWPRAGGLIIHETISRTTGGYAGLFDPSLGQIDVAYDADDYVVLHESAHAWFNGALLTDRWANEAFASYYGLEVSAALKLPASGDKLTPELEAARIPLNAWGAVGSQDVKTEDYAYAATLALARAIAERAGPEGLQAVWADAKGRIGAYQPPADPGISGVGGAAGQPETVAEAPDWRGLLDLLEAETAASYDDLWRRWVARESDLALLDARKAARTRYDGVVAAAGDWRLPPAVREAMRTWQFQQAEVLLTNASTVLDQRTAIASAAAESGLSVPPTLRTAFESPDGFASATLEATAELEAIRRYDAAVAARPAAPTLIQQAGLWNTTPEADLGRARALFASGDLAGSATAASAAAGTWAKAEDIGRGRFVSLGLLVLAFFLALILITVSLRGRRRARVARLAAAAAPSAGPAGAAGVVGVADEAPDAAAEPYATLAASTDPTEPVDVARDPLGRLG
jgi:hypothetical protein